MKKTNFRKKDNAIIPERASSKEAFAHVRIQKLQDIIRRLQKLEMEAAEVGHEDIAMFIGCAAKLCFAVYYFQLRGEYPTDAKT